MTKITNKITTKGIKCHGNVKVDVVESTAGLLGAERKT